MLRLREKLKYMFLVGLAEGDGVIFTKDKLGKLRSFKQ